MAHKNISIQLKELVNNNVIVLKVNFINFLVDSPPCLILVFVNNIHLYTKYPERCRFILVSFIGYFILNSFFSIRTFILNLFSEICIWIETCIFILFFRIHTCIFSWILTIHTCIHTSIYEFLYVIDTCILILFFVIHTFISSLHLIIDTLIFI